MGKKQVEIRLADPNAIPQDNWGMAAYAPRGHSEHPAILVDQQFTGGAMIDVIGHEFMQGLGLFRATCALPATPKPER